MKTILDQVIAITKANNISPNKDKGQNFLINAEVIDVITKSADLKKTDKVLEIGPGLGILTESLVKRAGHVVSVELDSKLYEFLTTNFKTAKNLELVSQDILKFNPIDHGLIDNQYKVVANLPYNITSVFLKKFFTQHRPAAMTLLLQKEVAQRICATVGQMSILSISVQLYGWPKIIDVVKADNFWPKPKVDSAIVKIENIKSQDQVDKFLNGLPEKEFWRIVKIGFSSRRKQLHNNLSSGLKISSEDAKKMLNKAKLDPAIRAQNLSIANWLNLAKSINL